MTTTRYFEVKVENCRTCPYSVNSNWNGFICQLKCKSIADSAAEANLIRQQNKDQLTDSCPMAAQHKTESNTK